MSSSLLPWLGRKQGPPPLPALPAVRPRRLSVPAVDGGAASAGAFFEILPAEIRRKILKAAFGGQTIHLDLRLAHPAWEPDTGKRKPFYHRLGSRNSFGDDNSPPQDPPWNRGPKHANTPSPYLRDRKKPRVWEWHSSVCHRPLPTTGQFDEYPAWEDRCHSGLKCWQVDCVPWSGEVPRKCYLGVMGWLRSCRSAYVEGVEVLYGTNRIHIAGTYLCRHLPDVVPQQRLASVAKIELVWDLRLWGAENGVRGMVEDQPADRGVGGYRATAAVLQKVFPGLRSLHLAITGPPIGYGRPEKIDLVELLLQPLDNAVRSMSVLQECRVSVPKIIFKELEPRVEAKGSESSLSKFTWSGLCEVRRILLPPPAVDSPGLLGYLVCQGVDDTGGDGMVHCFGS